jgi:hypothetical protein
MTPDLPAMDSAIVHQPDHHLVLPDPVMATITHRIHVSAGEGGAWQWANLLRAVSGWEVVAAGTLSAADYATAADAAQEIARRFQGEDGQGRDRLPREAYFQIGRIAHLRRYDEQDRAYCGVRAGRPAEFDTKVKDHAEQHCIRCDATYRAEHYGRLALTY